MTDANLILGGGLVVAFAVMLYGMIQQSARRDREEPRPPNRQAWEKWLELRRREHESLAGKEGR